MTEEQLGLLLAGVVGYLVGSVSPAALLARARGVDLRHTGSGNPGATNAGRAMGRRVGVVVAVLDVAKGLLPALLFGLVVGEPAGLVAGAAAVLGHVTSPWLHGRGGKGVATSLGAVLGVAPLWGLAALAVFGLVFWVSRWVALSSVVATLALPLLAAVALLAGWPSGSVARLVWAAFLAGVVVVRHRGNFAAWRREHAG
ncbi:MAG: glycerol-3-phosphate acyltransferase [Actinomycetia bacterium]|jgi:glycerol-3-phosphate acyltransferase PlsY|nr:glycerol-3-phosphate acyltransferase [Actinomycetes bacterium]